MARLAQGAADSACGMTLTVRRTVIRRPASGHSHNLDAGRAMVRRAKSTEMSSQAMIRSAFLLALACTLWTGAARAQASDADLVTRIDHLEAEIRDLTGTVEQLHYRNQQLEQEVQRLQVGAPAAPPQEPRAKAAPPTSSRYTVIPQYTPPPPAPYSPPPAPVIAAAPAAAPPPETGASPGGRGDAFNPALNPNAPGVPRPLGGSTTATEPPPPVVEAPVAAPAPRQPGAPLDLSSASAPPAAAPQSAELPPPPTNSSGTGAMQAALPPGGTPKDEYDLAYGYILQKNTGRPATRSVISCRNIRATGWRARRNIGSAKACFRTSNTMMPPRPSSRSPRNTKPPRARLTRCCGLASCWPLWVRRKPRARRSAKSCENIRALRRP